MTRLRILKQRAARGQCGITRLHNGWYVGTGRGGGDCYGPLTKREAIFMASRWALPKKPLIMTSS